jgi:hypothetical protein
VATLILIFKENLMRSKDLTELARNSDFISGIYNYCDRWCERCPLTSRCLLYASEAEDEDLYGESCDLDNAAFWQTLETVLQDTRSLIDCWVRQAGIDLREGAKNAGARREKRGAKAHRDGLALAAKEYAAAVDEWCRSCDEMLRVYDGCSDENELEETERIQEAREIIHWYQYQIAVKIVRALWSRADEVEWQDESSSGNDSDGLTKVALIGIDRSMSAWRLMQITLPEQSQSIVPLILSLERLRHRLEVRFPNARAFIRPGFDELLGEAN